MEIRRQNDIVAFKWQDLSPVAFHARNLEVAEISDELWAEMSTPADPELGEALEAWDQEENPAVKLGKATFGIRSLTINVTQICNLKCTYCAAGGDGTYGAAQTRISVEKTLPQLKFFLERMKPGENFRITFLGGEPLLYPEGIRAIANYVQLMTAGKEVKPHFSIVTNGTLFSDENIDLLRDIKCKITVSIDGPAQFNDAVRPLRNGKGSTASVVQGLEKLFARKHELGLIILHGVFHKDNMNVVEAYKFYREMSADFFDFTYGVSEADPASNAAFIEQINQVAKLAYELGGEAALRKIGFFDNIFSTLDEQQRTENFCGAGKSYLVVDARNNLYTCPWDVGNDAEKVGQGDQINAEAIAAYQAPLIEQNNCQSCWARYICGGGCMYIHKQSTGDKHKKNKEFCVRTQSLISTAIVYYKQSRNAC
jgi:uncharacterized protein